MVVLVMMMVVMMKTITIFDGKDVDNDFNNTIGNADKAVISQFEY